MLRITRLPVLLAVSFLAATLACTSLPDVNSGVRPAGLDVPPGQAALVRMYHLCDHMLVDGREVTAPRGAAPRWDGRGGLAYNVTVPAGHRAITYVHRYAQRGCLDVPSPDTLPVRLLVVAGHHYRTFWGGPSLVRDDSLRFTDDNECVTDVTAGDTVCARAVPRPSADTAVLTISWVWKGLVVDEIDGEPVRVSFFGFPGPSQSRVALAAGRHSLAVRNYTTSTLSQGPGAYLASHSVSGLPCRLAFEVEGGHVYNLSGLYSYAPRRGLARLDLSKLVGWTAHVTTTDLRGRPVSDIATCSRAPDGASVP